MASRITRQRAQGCARDARTLAFGSVANAGSGMGAGVDAGAVARSVPPALRRVRPFARCVQALGVHSRSCELEPAARQQLRAGRRSLEGDREALCLDGEPALGNSVSPRVGARALGVARPSPLRVLRDAARGARPSPLPNPRPSPAPAGGRRTAPDSDSCSEAFSRTSSARGFVRHLPERAGVASTLAGRCRVIPPPRTPSGRRDTGGAIRVSGRNSQ